MELDIVGMPPLAAAEMTRAGILVLVHTDLSHMTSRSFAAELPQCTSLTQPPYSVDDISYERRFDLHYDGIC